MLNILSDTILPDIASLKTAMGALNARIDQATGFVDRVSTKRDNEGSYPSGRFHILSSIKKTPNAAERLREQFDPISDLCR